jgi:hypothetical protein
MKTYPWKPRPVLDQITPPGLGTLSKRSCQVERSSGAPLGLGIRGQLKPLPLGSRVYDGLNQDVDIEKECGD